MLTRTSGNFEMRKDGRIALRIGGYFDANTHWIKEQQQTLQSIRRCLKAGGRIGIQFPFLDSTHPLIAVSQSAIRSLGLEHRYATWESPWFVPESSHAYADLLQSLSFKNIIVRQSKTTYAFDTALIAHGFFSSVGLELFLQPLSAEEAASLKSEVLKLLFALETERGVSLVFHRLYVFATT